ncbi:MAG TPA: MFS transporter [Alphaproteobacteria bacterium]|nr:MFS transporter [Alphaproteobacteria bacterium]
MIFMALAMPLSFSTWRALLNNFAVERASFGGVEIGILQSLREIPGFLAAAVVFLLFIMREQTIAMVSLMLLGLGTAATGFFPSVIGLYVTTVIMSIGFHYYETVRQSLVLQWIDKDRAPRFMGLIISVGSFSGIAALLLVYLLLDLGKMDMTWVYLIGGGLTIGFTIFCRLAFPAFPQKVEQHKRLVMRRRYWLFYALTFMAGARRQIFIVFAGFLMVEKFGFDAAQITLIFLAGGVLTVIAAPILGHLIGRWGERRALAFEYIGLIVIFTSYAFVETPWIVVTLYILDNVFFSMAIAIKTYFQKIAEPADMAATAGVAFTINHIAAVVLPVTFGLLWALSPAAVFLTGTAIAVFSLALSLLVPNIPTPRNVALVGWFATMPDAAAR